MFISAILSIYQTNVYIHYPLTEYSVCQYVIIYSIIGKLLEEFCVNLIIY